MSDTVMDYATIKALAAATKGVTVVDLIALAPHRDSFYIGSPTRDYFEQLRVYKAWRNGLCRR